MTLLFALLATIAVVCGILMIVQENPVRSALFLVLVMFSLAVLYLTLNAAFIAAVQVVVYAGAIMVLFIFVIMLLNLGAPGPVADRLKPQTFVGGPVMGIVLIGVLISLLTLAPLAAYKNVALPISSWEPMRSVWRCSTRQIRGCSRLRSCRSCCWLRRLAR